MNIFEIFTRINHPSVKNGWCDVTAYFTGKTEKAAVGKPGHYKQADHYEYEIQYLTDDGERYGWYVFHPLEDPDPETIKGKEIRIRYSKRKPWKFEAI